MKSKYYRPHYFFDEYETYLYEKRVKSQILNKRKLQKINNNNYINISYKSKRTGWV